MPPIRVLGLKTITLRPTRSGATIGKRGQTCPTSAGEGLGTGLADSEHRRAAAWLSCDDCHEQIHIAS
jgi:hypothetical protein